MSETREWDGQVGDGLRLLRASRVEDVACVNILDEITERERKIADIEAEARGIAERPVTRACERSRLLNEVRDLKRLAREKGCP